MCESEYELVSRWILRTIDDKVVNHWHAARQRLGKRTMDPFSYELAVELQRLLQLRDHCIVFAESCTAGLIAASLGRLPGASAWLAGSAVVYQTDSKAQWLDVDREALQNPGPVSPAVSEQMVHGVLQKTAQATIAASVTGHLGPDAPTSEDGTAWSSVGVRKSGAVVIQSRQLHLDEGTDTGTVARMSPTERRHMRQIRAAQQVLQFCIEQLQPGDP